jgi:hypothetical protein
MTNRYFSLEEFQALFPDRFASREEMLREYASFLSVLDHLDETRVPELSAREKAEIFHRSWREPSYESSRLWTWLVFLRQPAVTFALGIILGCALMSAVTGSRLGLVQPAAADQSLIVEHMGHTQAYRGTIIDGLYPQIENPRIVLEGTDGSTPKRVLYGTIHDGEIDLVWNL